MLYKNIRGIEFDDDSDGKCTGTLDGCYAKNCSHAHWDYVGQGGDSVVKNHAIYDVMNIADCLQICRLKTDCRYIRYATKLVYKTSLEHHHALWHGVSTGHILCLLLDTLSMSLWLINSYYSLKNSGKCYLKNKNALAGKWY